MISVSVKQLRTDLPKILKKVEDGEEFLIIYRSKPIGELVPLSRRTAVKRRKSLYDFVEKPFGEVHFGKGKSSVDLIRADRN